MRQAASVAVLWLATILPTPVAAQSAAEAPGLSKAGPADVKRPLRGQVGNHRYAELDLATGRITVFQAAPPWATARLPRVPVLANLSGALKYYSLWGPGQGLFTYFDKRSTADENGVLANTSNVVAAFQFDYASRAQDPSFGGPGATVHIALTEQGLQGTNAGFAETTSYGFTRPFETAKRKTLTGLPTGNATQSSGTPTLTVWTLRVVLDPSDVWILSNSLAYHAYGIAAGDSNPDGLADTAVVVRDSSQPHIASLTAGAYDVFDPWTSGAVASGVLPGAPDQSAAWADPNESVGFWIEELHNFTSTTTVIGSPPAPQVAELHPSEAHIAFPFRETVDCFTFPLHDLAIYKAVLAPALSTPIPSKFGDIWLPPGPSVTRFAVHHGETVTFSLGTIPFDPSLHGRPFTTQAFCGGDDPFGRMTNAVQHVIDADYTNY